MTSSPLEPDVSVQGRECVGHDPVVVAFSGEFDAGDSGFSEELLDRVGEGPSRVIVDMLNVSFIDSSVIRALVIAHRKVTSTGGWLRVVYTHHLVRRVIEMCGLAEIFPQYPTLEAARRDVSSPPPSSEVPEVEGKRP